MGRNDILRKHGVIPEKAPSPGPVIEEALAEARHLAHENRLEGKDLDELAELEDDEDEAFLHEYKQKRLHEIAALRQASVYGQVYPVQKLDYARDVTEASATAWVLVLLTSSSGMNVESQRMVELWRGLAARFGDVKFCQMQADLCIEGYPDRNTPTVLVYKDGQIRRQVVTLRELGGVRTGEEDVERVLLALGAVQHGDRRLSGKKVDVVDGDSHRSIRQGDGGVTGDEDDSDWD